jgi:hypothetical protein
MDGEITEQDRVTLLRLAVAKVDSADLRTALGTFSGQRAQLPTAVGNAMNALRKHRDPAGVVGKAQYRAALPYVAAVIADPCVARTIEVLGDHSDDPTREQLLEALDAIADEFNDTTVAVMLASVAESEMPASDLCFDVATTDARFGLSAWREAGVTDAPSPPPAPAPAATTPEQREARRLRKQEAANDRKKRLEASRKAAEQVRRNQKRERTLPGGDRPDGATGSDDTRDSARGAPRLVRRAALTPVQEAAFDRDDPWVGGVVFAWVPFTTEDPEETDLGGKSRRCVVVAASDTQLLVRPGYSEGGVKSKDWKSVPLTQWRHAGFDQPTWIDVEMLRVPRDEESPPVGWLSTEDWNALW